MGTSRGTPRTLRADGAVARAKRAHERCIADQAEEWATAEQALAAYADSLPLAVRGEVEALVADPDRLMASLEERASREVSVRSPGVPSPEAMMLLPRILCRSGPPHGRATYPLQNLQKQHHQNIHLKSIS